MPAETVTRNGRVVPEHAAAIVEADEEEALRAEAIEQIRHERRFKVHMIVLPVVTLLVGASWVLTEYYTAHTHHMWPSSFADAPADRPGVWSTWFFYFVGVMIAVAAIDAYRTYAKPYMQRRVPNEQVNRKVEQLKSRR